MCLIAAPRQREAEGSVELFGDFVDIVEELKKGQHEELGYQLHSGSVPQCRSNPADETH